MNPGGLRADLASGEVTYREAANVQPFANTLVTLELTGAQVKQVLEEQWQPAGASRPFLKLGVNKALTYTYDPAGPVGNRITEILLDGTPLDPTRRTLGRRTRSSRRVETTSSPRARARTRPTAARSTSSRWSTTSPRSADTITPDYAQRAVGVEVVGDGTYAPGEPGDGQPVVARLQPHRPGPARSWSRSAEPARPRRSTGRSTPTFDEIGKATVVHRPGRHLRTHAVRHLRADHRDDELVRAERGLVSITEERPRARCPGPFPRWGSAVASDPSSRRGPG